MRKKKSTIPAKTATRTGREQGPSDSYKLTQGSSMIPPAFRSLVS